LQLSKGIKHLINKLSTAYYIDIQLNK